MRRWVCVIALLYGFGGEGYAWTIRPRNPIPIVRILPAPVRNAGLVPTVDWWRR